MEDITFKTSNLMLWVAMFLFSVAAPLLVHEFLKKNNYSTGILLVFLFADPLFFSMRQNSALLIICALCLLFVWNDIREKPILNRNIFFFIVVALTLIIHPKAILSYAPVIAVLYFLPKFTAEASEYKTPVMVITAVLSVAAGLGVNKLLEINSEAFVNFISGLYVPPTPIKGDYIFYIFAVVAIIINILAFAPIFGIKENKHDQSGFSTIATFSQISIAVSFISSFFLGTETLYAVGIITPLIFIILACRNSKEALNITKIINTYIQKNTLLFALGFVFLMYVVLYVLFHYNPGALAVIVLDC